MKKVILLMAVLCLLLAGCSGSKTNTNEPVTDNTGTGAADQGTTTPETTPTEEQTEPALTVSPLPDTTMDNLTDATLAVSLEEGSAYVDDTGKMQMDLKIYTYDMYDAADIAMLKVGDTVVTHAGEVVVTSLERNESGLVFVNGGLENGGFDLTAGGGGVFYEVGFNDAKNWYEAGEATIRVSADFRGYDNADPDKGEVLLYPGDFLIDGVVEYNFTPYNTTIRVEGGQIIEMNRSYTP